MINVRGIEQGKVRGVVRAAKKGPGNMRGELEDETGSLTLFADRDCEISSRDYVYALVGDKGIHMHCDAFEYQDTDLHNVIKLMNKGKEHYNKYLYDHGLGIFGDEKSLMYCFDFRVFKTSKGTKMANMYCWDEIGRASCRERV